jgi:CBS domain-containing protein
MKLQDIMIRDVVQAVPDEPVGEAAKRMRQRGVGCLVVTVAGAVKGIVTDRDLLDCLAESHDPSCCPVSAHMNRPVIILGPEEDHKMAAKVLHRKKSNACRWRNAGSQRDRSFAAKLSVAAACRPWRRILGP